ncbi:MAG: HAMP domain-containing sensor histidine kinase [Bacteroidota bacterium]
MATRHKILGLLIGLVALPILISVGLEMQSAGSQEALIEAIYDQQLDGLLYAADQHAYNVTDSWSTSIRRTLAEPLPPTANEAMRQEMRTSTLRAFLTSSQSVEALLLYSRSRRSLRYLGVDAETERPVDVLDQARLDELTKFATLGYWPIEPIRWTEDTEAHPALFFATPRTPDGIDFVGLVVDPEAFIGSVFVPKIEEVSRDQFHIGIFADGQEDPLYATSPLVFDDVKQLRDIWFLDGYTLGIRLAAGTVEALVEDRLTQRLTVIGVIALALLAVAGVLYGTVRREMELSRMKSDFVSNVSHELRTPLALIRMFAETLELGRVPTEERRQDYYRIIGQETDRLTRLVNTILDFSRMEAGEKTYQQAPIQLNEVVTEVLDVYAYHLDSKGFSVHVELTPGLAPIQGDTEALAEALINLIDNAVKYSPKAQYLGVRTGQEEHEVYVEVEDHGLGIAEADQKRIFDKFVRVSSALVHDTKGTGLGLALLRHIMHAHRGRVTLDSTEGVGSRFRLWFPVVDQPALHSPHPSSAAP